MEYKLYFEWDEKKNLINQIKHGISFEQARILWTDENQFVFAATSLTEQRYAITGLIENKYWTAFFTIRNDSIRIISVRHARIEEIRNYE